MIACDGCGSSAPPNHAASFPDREWIGIVLGFDHGPSRYLDVCSWECLATVVASRIAEEATA